MELMLKLIEKAKKNKIGTVNPGGDFTKIGDRYKYYSATKDTEELFNEVQDHTSEDLYPNYDCNTLWFDGDDLYAEWEEVNGDDVIDRLVEY